jgi:hypothetical protein
MEKFDLYSDYLDGNLNDAQEKELLYELSSSDELRAEFRQLIAVNRSGSQIAKGYFVPDSSTSKIFAGVGIAATGTTTGAIGLLHVLKSSPVFMPAAVSIITAICIFAFADIAGYKFVRDDVALNNIPVMSSEAGNNSMQGRNLADEIKSIESKNNSIQNNNDYAVNSVIKHNFNNDLAGIWNHSDIIENEINLNNEENLYNLRNSEIDYSSQNYNLSNRRTESINHNINSAHYQPFTFDIGDSDNPLSIEVRNSQYWNIPAATITPSRFADFHNMAIDMKYNFKNGISVGADVRRETFFQKFDFVDELNQYTIIEQQPNFTTLSLNLAYNFDTGGSVIPFAQVSVGGNVVGAVSRLMAGASYRISDNFMLNISGEYSNMTYSYKSSIFNSPKFGFNYGISYKF